jgi:hypothetical protein
MWWCSLELRIQELFGRHAGLFEDGTERPFGHVTRMVGDRGVSMRRGVHPNLVTPGSLTVELKSEGFEPLDDFPVSEPG